MIYVVYFVHVIISIFLILVVLLQQGKGADLSVFGGGASQAAFGARGAATLLHKLTVACFVLFIITTLSIGIMQARRQPSVMSDVAEEEAPASTAPAPASSAPAPAPATMDESAPAQPAEAPATSPATSEGAASDQGAASNANEESAGSAGAADEGESTNQP